MAVGLFAFAGLLGILYSRGRQSRVWALIGGILLGFAVGVKYTAFLTAAVALGAMAFPRKGRSNPNLELIAYILGGALLAFIPWLLKGVLESGNPFYPVATNLLGGGYGRQLSDWSRWMMQIESHGYLFGSYESAADKLRAAWTLATVEGLPCVLPVLSLSTVALMWRPGLPGAPWAGLSLASFALWTLGPPQSRFLIQSLPIMAAALEFSLGRWPASSPVRIWLLRFFLCVAAFETSTAWVFPPADRPARLLTAAGLVDSDVYLRARLTSYADAVLWANRHLPEWSRVLIYGDRRYLPLARRVIIPSYAEPAPFLDLAEESRDPAHLGRKLRQIGITHLFYNRMHAVYYRARFARFLHSERCLGLWTEYWRTHSSLLYESSRMDLKEGAYYLFSLDEKPPESSLLVLPGVEGWLYVPEYLLAEGDLGGARAAFSRLEGIVGDVAMVRQAYAMLFRPYLPRAEAGRILKDVDARGLRSVTLYLELAKLALEDGKSALAVGYMNRAKALDLRNIRKVAAKEGLEELLEE